MITEAKRVHNRTYYQANRQAILEAKRKQTPEEILHDEITIAESKAWDALSRYKFQMFGYWAAIFVHLNRISGERRPNPFTGLVQAARVKGAPGVRRCRICGCTDDDCHQCIEKTGQPCHWVEADLCSACVGQA